MAMQDKIKRYKQAISNANQCILDLLHNRWIVQMN